MVDEEKVNELGTTSTLTVKPDAEDLELSEKKAPVDTFMGDFPEGGFRAWATMAGAWGVMFVSFGMAQAFGVFQDYYSRILLNEFSPSQISWIGSVQICLLYAMGIFTGIWFDKGYFNHMLIPGSVIYIVSFFMLSLCKPNAYYQFLLAQGFGMGIGIGLMAVPSISIISHYFHARRALAAGVVFSGTSLAGIIWPILFNRMFFSHIGFAWGVRIGAFISLGLLVFANIIMKPRLSVLEYRARQPKGNFRLIMSDGCWWVCLLGTFVVILGLSFPFTYLQLFAELHGVPNNISQYSLAILFASGTVFGRMLPGLLADRYGVINVILPYTIVGGALIFAMFGASSTAGLVLFAVFYGPCGGAFNSLFAASLGIYSNNVSEFGMRLGISGVVFGVGYLIGTPITGALLQAPKYDWNISIIFSGVAVLLGCFIIIISRQMLVKKRGTQRV